MSNTCVVRTFFMFPLFFIPLMHGSCVQEGMNLWRLTENISCSVGAVCELRQSNFTAIISVPGYYKLCEDITFANEFDLSITADDVVLDLGGYSVENVNIGILPNIKNVTIKNGTVKNSVVPLQVDFGTQNILIEDIIIDTILPGIVPANAAAILSSGGTTGLTVRNITIYNGAPKNINFYDLNGFHQDLVFENIVCEGTNSDFVDVPTNPSAVIYIKSTHNLTLKNITVANQWQELNGIIIDSCEKLYAQNVFITTSATAPAAQTVAYQVSNSFDGIHKNIYADGGQNSVFQYGISFAGSLRQELLASLVTYTKGTGIFLGDDCAMFDTVVDSTESVSVGASNYVQNCVAKNSALGIGFIVIGSASILRSCVAYSNGSIGFYLLASGTQCLDCVAERNSQGITVEGDDSIVSGCVANYNDIAGIFINVGDGCLVMNCTANNNGLAGILVTNIVAESLFVAGAPVNNNTWNIGQFPRTNTNPNGALVNHNVRLVNNTALRNGDSSISRQIAMNGVVYDTATLAGPVSFGGTPVFPPIGIVNTLQGSIYDDPKPKQNTAIGALVGVISPTTGFPLFANSVGGNVASREPVPSL